MALFNANRTISIAGASSDVKKCTSLRSVFETIRIITCFNNVTMMNQMIKLKSSSHQQTTYPIQRQPN